MINNIPSTNRKDFGFKTINSSREHNLNQEAMLNDVLDLFNKVNLIEKKVNENYKYIKEENTLLSTINSTLIKKYKDLENRYNQILTQDKVRKNIIMPYDCKITSNLGGAVIDKRTNDITIRPSKKVSKVILLDDITDTAYIPDSLNVITVTKCNGLIAEKESDIYSPFYYNDNFYYTKEVITDDTSDEVIVDYIITLPESIMTTTDLNEIFISPFLCNIHDVQYRYGDSSKWVSVPNLEDNESIYPTHNITELCNNVKPVKINVKDIKANQIKIILKTNIYKSQNTNTRVFNLGLKEVGIYKNYYNMYQANTFEFDTEIKETDTIKITSIVPYYNNNSSTGEFSGDFYCDIYYKDDADNIHKVLDEYPFTPQTNKLHVKCVIGERFKEVNIKYIVINYIVI